MVQVDVPEVDAVERPQPASQPRICEAPVLSDALSDAAAEAELVKRPPLDCLVPLLTPNVLLDQQRP